MSAKDTLNSILFRIQAWLELLALESLKISRKQAKNTH